MITNYLKYAVKRFKQCSVALTRLISSDRYEKIILLMTLIMVLLYMQHSRILMGVIILFVPVGILFMRVLKSPTYWAILAIFIIVGFYQITHSADNHTYLTVYWIIAIALSFQTRQRIDSISLNARLLIGLCFGFATLWKILSPEFIDGTFFHFTFLTDSRFFDFTELTAGLSSDIRHDNLDSYNLIKSSTERKEFVQLISSPSLSTLSIFMAYWTILLEGWIAVAFLAPVESKLSKYRDNPLLIFMITTYPIATVRGFATLLAVMGFAQCRGNNSGMRIIYLLIFLLIPIFSLPFERMIIDLLNIFS